MKELENKQLAKRIRESIIETASEGGFHFSSSLGVVELVIALYRVFDFEKNQVVFDVGHQRFPYLMLRDGHFNVPHYEDYSMFIYPGFAGLSAASAEGLSVNDPENKVIAVIGDGSLTCGEVFESLNNIGAHQSNVLVVLNENGQSIVDNVGALSDGKSVRQYAESLKFEYIGTADGHNTEQLVEILEGLKQKKHPVFLHVITQKGKGYLHSESNPALYHRPTTSFDVHTGKILPNQDVAKAMMGESLDILQKKSLAMLEKGESLYLISPACPLFPKVAEKYPKNVFDTGISEQHCMTFSTTLAAKGNKVICTIIAPFLSRCYSQILDLAHQNAPLVISVPMMGANALGSTHQAVHMLGALRQIPNLSIVHAINMKEYEMLLDEMLEVGKPGILFVPKENVPCEVVDNYEYGKGFILREGYAATILPIGSMFSIAIQLAEKYEGIEIINPRYLKPLDLELLFSSIKKTGRLLILEDGLKVGGLGEEVISKIFASMPHVHCKHIGYTSLFPKYEAYDKAIKEYDFSFVRCMNTLSELLQLEKRGYLKCA
ncbi:MAG: 1-deoxy-D-xylulose-5-phosphate synthase N-terminal domain-containing protein [Gammaproteobacteria bacterium]